MLDQAGMQRREGVKGHNYTFKSQSRTTAGPQSLESSAPIERSKLFTWEGGKGEEGEGFHFWNSPHMKHWKTYSGSAQDIWSRVEGKPLRTMGRVRWPQVSFKQALRSQNLIQQIPARQALSRVR